MGQPSYTYNAQGRAITAGGSTISYDAFNREVELQTSNGYTQFVYAPDGFKFAYMHGQSVAKYVAPLTAGLQAVYTAALPAPPAFWRHSDWLGTVRLDSTPAQTVYFDGGWAPFGETYAGMGTSDRSFTGQTQDTGVGLYDFLFRQYSPTQGRWIVPDPAGLAAVDITNPQTWNRYAYVGNNPLSAIDPLGLYMDVCPIDYYGGDCEGRVAHPNISGRLATMISTCGPQRNELRSCATFIAMR
jgi:RHS repeat-associated protein